MTLEAKGLFMLASLEDRSSWYQFGCGILKLAGPMKQDFWPKINILQRTYVLWIELLICNSSKVVNVKKCRTSELKLSTKYCNRKCAPKLLFLIENNQKESDETWCRKFSLIVAFFDTVSNWIHYNTVVKVDTF